MLVFDFGFPCSMKLVRHQREIYDRALLNDIGHGNPRIHKQFITTIAYAEELVELVNASIEEQLRHLATEQKTWDLRD